MYCTHCGSPLPEGARFCVACGQQLVQQPPQGTSAAKINPGAPATATSGSRPATFAGVPPPARPPSPSVSRSEPDDVDLEAAAGIKRTRVGARLVAGIAGAVVFVILAVALCLGSLDQQLPQQTGLALGLGDSVATINKVLAGKQIFPSPVFGLNMEYTPVGAITGDGGYVAMLEPVASVTSDLSLQRVNQLWVEVRGSHVTRLQYRRRCATPACRSCECSSRDWTAVKGWLPWFGWETTKSLSSGTTLDRVYWLRFGWNLEASYVHSGDAGSIAIELNADGT